MSICCLSKCVGKGSSSQVATEEHLPLNCWYKIGQLVVIRRGKKVCFIAVTAEIGLDFVISSHMATILLLKKGLELLAVFSS